MEARHLGIYLLPFFFAACECGTMPDGTSCDVGDEPASLPLTGRDVPVVVEKPFLKVVPPSIKERSSGTCQVLVEVKGASPDRTGNLRVGLERHKPRSPTEMALALDACSGVPLARGDTCTFEIHFEDSGLKLGEIATGQAIIGHDTGPETHVIPISFERTRTGCDGMAVMPSK